MAKKSFKSGTDEILGVQAPHQSIQTKEKEDKTEARTTIVTKSHQINKLKAIAFWDRKSLKEVFEEAISMYLDNYEKQNGEIKNIKH